MIRFKINPLLIAIGLSCVSASALAQVHSPKLEVNSINGDRIVASVSFDAPVIGDLYLATLVNGVLEFITPGSKFTYNAEAYQKNGNFADEIPVLDYPSDGVPPAKYPLFQVVTKPGADPHDFNNWIGGLNGLSQIDFNVNLNNTTPAATPTPVPNATPTPAPTTIPGTTPTPAPTAAPTSVPTVAPTSVPGTTSTPVPTVAPTTAPTPVPTVAPTTAPTPVPTVAPTPVPTATPTPAPEVLGKALYATNCSSSSCHGPGIGSAKTGKSAAKIQAAINANTGGMGSLSGLSATEVSNIAAYLVAPN